MRAAAVVEASHPIITFGKPHTHINWQGDQACSTKMASSLMGDQALFPPQSLSGSGDSTQEAVSEPIDHRLITRESHNGRHATAEPRDRWIPKVQDWQEMDEDYEPPGSERTEVGKGVKRRTGRPLSYTGDPNSPHLSEAARRKIRRRVSNRESARRIRDRRIQETSALQAQVEQLEQQNTLLMHQAERAEAHRAKLEMDLQQLETRITKCANENEQLHEEASLLRQAVEAKMPLLEQSCGKEEGKVQQLASAKEGHSAQATIAVTPFDSGNQATKGFDLDTSMYLLPSMDLERLTTSYFGDGYSHKTGDHHPPSAAMTPVPSLDLGKLPSCLLTAEF